MKTTTWVTILAVLVLAGLFWSVGLQGQRVTEPTPPPVVTMEYLLIPPADIGIPLDILKTVHYEETTWRLNELAAEGWRVRDFGMFELPAVLLEREVVHAPAGEE